MKDFTNPVLESPIIDKKFCDEMRRQRKVLCFIPKSPEESATIQKHLLDMGYSWLSGERVPLYTSPSDDQTPFILYLDRLQRVAHGYRASAAIFVHSPQFTDEPGLSQAFNMLTEVVKKYEKKNPEPAPRREMSKEEMIDEIAVLRKRVRALEEENATLKGEPDPRPVILKKRIMPQPVFT